MNGEGCWWKKKVWNWLNNNVWLTMIIEPDVESVTQFGEKSWIKNMLKYLPSKYGNSIRVVQKAERLKSLNMPVSNTVDGSDAQTKPNSFQRK